MNPYQARSLRRSLWGVAAASAAIAALSGWSLLFPRTYPPEVEVPRVRTMTFEESPHASR